MTTPRRSIGTDGEFVIVADYGDDDELLSVGATTFDELNLPSAVVEQDV